MDKLKAILIIQKYIRRYLIQKYILIPSSFYQTKIWRINRIWYINGKLNECEKYQIHLIEKIINTKLIKTNERINIEINQIVDIKQPLINNDGFEYSENFDRKLIKNSTIFYFNFKFVCDNGGAQIRTLKDVYNFIKYQLKYLIKINELNTIYFINILDGDTCYKNSNKFSYLINKEKYKYIVNNIFIGDLYTFQKNKIKLLINNR